MSEASPSAYEVLGVDPAASHDEIRRAYRRLLRQTHPDLGGSAARFHAVQRAWAVIETPELRRAYDLESVRAARPNSSSARPAGSARPTATEPSERGSSPYAGPASQRGPSPYAASSRPVHPQPEDTPKARSYGHPGGEARSVFFRLMREWAGRGATVDNPYDPSLLRSAPREIRQWLAKAQAEEATASTVTSLGPDFTIWNDIQAGSDGVLDHVVLGPGGLFAISSEDWGSEIVVERGEVRSARLEPGETPVKWFTRRAKVVARSAGVKFSGLLMVVPDGALSVPMALADRKRTGSVVIVRRQMLPSIVLHGAPDWGLAPVKRWGRDDMFETRELLRERLRLV